MNWGESYYDHFAHYFHEPIGRAVFKDNRLAYVIQIGSYKKFADFHVFCSLGLTHYSVEVNGIIEVVLPANGGAEEIPSILGQTLLAMVEKSEIVRHGTCVRGFVGNISTLMTRLKNPILYFTDPFLFPADFAQVQCDGRRGSVYMASFISEAEFAFVQQKGAAQFDALLKEKNVNLYDLSRPSVL